MRGLAYRIFLTMVNIIFPPAAIMILCGASWDCMLNCAFFILAVIPSHIHGFYLTCTYFHRRSKVRKGRYPGGPKSMIHSEYVLNGGASNEEVERLWRKENGGAKRNSRRSSRRHSEGRKEMAERVEGDLQRRATNSSRTSRQGHDLQPGYINRDEYGRPLPQLPLRPGHSASNSAVGPAVSNVSGRRKW